MGLRGAGKQLTRRITALNKSHFSSGLNRLPCAGGHTGTGQKGGTGGPPSRGWGRDGGLSTNVPER